MKPIKVLLIITTLIISQFGQAQTPGPPPVVPPGQKEEEKPKEGPEKEPTYQVKLLEPKLSDSDKPDSREVVEMRGLIRIGVYGGLGKEISEQVKSDRPSVSKNLKLYLNGVAMEGIEPLVLPPDGYQQNTPPPLWVLQFQLSRDASNGESDFANRKAWDKLLPGLNVGESNIQIGVGFRGAPPHLGEGRELKFQVSSAKTIYSVISIGIVLFAVLMYLAVRSNMLREGGTNTVHSLGKSQMAFWGLLVAISFAGVYIISNRMERIPEQVLVLLGISGVTGLSAILIGESKRSAAGAEASNQQNIVTRLEADQSAERTRLRERKAALEALKAAGVAAFPPASQSELDEVDKSIKLLDEKLATARKSLETSEKEASPSTDVEGWFKDIISDANGLSFHRFQVVLWTIILGAVFIWTVSSTFSMPEFENTLLLLMGISNGTYLGFKIPEKTTKDT